MLNPTSSFFLCPAGAHARVIDDKKQHVNKQEDLIMAFFQSAVGVLQTLVIALGAGLGVWGVINLLEGYGNDNPGANAHVR